MSDAQIQSAAESALKSSSGYRYNPDALEAAVASGVPDGAIVSEQPGLIVTREGNQLVGRDPGTGNVLRSYRWEGDMADQGRIMYAMRQAKQGVAPRRGGLW